MIRTALASLAAVTLVGSVAWGAESAESESKAAESKAAAGTKTAASSAKSGSDSEEVGVIETNMGTIVVRFYDKDAPKTTANFKKLAREGFYNGTTFHRVIPGFVV